MGQFILILKLARYHWFWWTKMTDTTHSWVASSWMLTKLDIYLKNIDFSYFAEISKISFMGTWMKQ